MKQSAPIPRRPAFSNVAGLPHASHSGGCGTVQGRGRTVRDGIEKPGPSWEYGASVSIRTTSGSASSNRSRVSSGPGMPKPRYSVLDEPRPVPSSKRPRLRWSSIATRSATRAGWFTGGVRLKIPEPMWICSVRAAAKPMRTSLAETCEYSSRKWCSVNHEYLKPLRSPATATSTSSCMRRCSMARCASAVACVGT